MFPGMHTWIAVPGLSLGVLLGFGFGCDFVIPGLFIGALLGVMLGLLLGGVPGLLSNKAGCVAGCVAWVIVGCVAWIRIWIQSSFCDSWPFLWNNILILGLSQGALLGVLLADGHWVCCLDSGLNSNLDSVAILQFLAILSEQHLDSRAVAGCGSRAVAGCIGGCTAWIVVGCVAWIVLAIHCQNFVMKN